MEYDSRPKTKLFTLKDEKGETKEIFFVARKLMAILGVVLALIVSGLVHFFANDIWIAIGVGLAVGLPAAFFPVHSDMKQEEYFTPLIDKIMELLSEFGIDLSKQDVMDLLSFKEFRIDDEYVLVTETKNGELIVSVVSDKISEKVKEKKPDVFPVVINEKVESDFKPKAPVISQAELEEAPEAEGIVEEAPEVDPIAESAPEAETDSDKLPETESEKASDESVSKTHEKAKTVGISAFPASGNEYTATSTGVMNIISPLTMSTPVVGEIAPGVTGPIPMTVGDGSVVYEDSVAPIHNLGNHADPYVPLSTEEPASTRLGRHGRRSAVQ